MNEVPNWFRWLIIIIATLIMCACRSPLQDVPTSTTPQSVLVTSSAAKESLPGSPLLPPISVANNVTLSQGVALPNGRVTNEPLGTTPTQKQVSNQTRVIELLESDLELDSTSLNRVAPQPNVETTMAPVVRRTDSGLQLQEVKTDEKVIAANSVAKAESSNAKPSTPELPTTDTEKSPSTAVYMHVGDDEPIEPTSALMDANVGTDLGSPYREDAVILAEQPLAPVVDSNFGDRSIVENTVVDEISVDGSAQPILQPPVEVSHIVGTNSVMEASPVCDQPVLVEDAALPLDQQPHVFNLAPHEEYLPVEEIPVELAPERWAQDPYAQDGGRNIPQGEMAKRYPDEYICDGGDANGQVFVMNDWSIRNLDPEDTIGHYDTKAGEVVVEPSNRVCVYAPRFAVARQVTSAFQNEKHEQLLVAAAGVKPALDEMQQATNQFDSTLAPQRHVLMQPASSFRVRQQGITGIQRKAVNIMAYDVSPHEDFRIMKLGIHKQSEKPRLAEFAAKADTWTNDKAVQVLVDEEVARTNVSRRGAETFFSIGDNGPAKLRVVKTASKSDALPGEEIEFTLRFDNVGYQTIGNVTIVDNLTTRLEFIDDSDLCSVDSTFLVGDNEAESLMLRWEIKEPIEPGKGGLIRFRCRMR